MSKNNAPLKFVALCDCARRPALDTSAKNRVICL